MLLEATPAERRPSPLLAIEMADDPSFPLSREEDVRRVLKREKYCLIVVGEGLVDKDGKSDAFGNSGVQYRSKIVKPEYFVVSGYQADMECGKTYSGILYEEKGRGILAKRGQKVVITDGEDPKKPKIEAEAPMACWKLL